MPSTLGTTIQLIASLAGLPTRLSISTGVSIVNFAVFWLMTSDTRGWACRNQIVSTSCVGSDQPRPGGGTRYQRLLKESFAGHGPAPQKPQLIDLSLWGGAMRCQNSLYQRYLIRLPSNISITK